MGMSLMCQESGIQGTRVPNFTKDPASHEMERRTARSEGVVTHSGAVRVPIGPMTTDCLADEVARPTANSRTSVQFHGVVSPNSDYD